MGRALANLMHDGAIVRVPLRLGRGEESDTTFASNSGWWQRRDSNPRPRDNEASEASRVRTCPPDSGWASQTPQRRARIPLVALPNWLTRGFYPIGLWRGKLLGLAVGLRTAGAGPPIAGALRRVRPPWGLHSPLRASTICNRAVPSPSAGLITTTRAPPSLVQKSTLPPGKTSSQLPRRFL